MTKLFKLLLTVLLFLPLLTAVPVFADGEDFEIKHSDNLDILPDRLILSGEVVVGTKGPDQFTLFTERLVSFKDLSGEYSTIETFGRSKIESSKFTLVANKIYFYKNAKTKKYDLMDASGSVEINSKDSSRKVTAPKVKIALDTKKLYAVDGVVSEQIVDNNGTKQVVTITSVEQDINLEESSQSQTLNKQLIARQKVVTKLETALVNSEKAEIYTLNGKSEKAIFTNNASLLTDDGTKAVGEKITYYLVTKLLVIDSGASAEDKNLVQANNKLASKAFLKVPYTEKDNSISFITITADSIGNREINPSESLLFAKNTDEETLVELDYGTRRGWGKELFISQNKAVPEKKADNLFLIGNAKLVDFEKNQTLEGAVIQIGLGEKNLYSGLTGRSSGFVPLEEKTTEKKPANPVVKNSSKNKK